MTSEDAKSPADRHRNPRAVGWCGTSIVVQDRADAAVLGEQRIAAVAEQVQVERLVGLPFAVALDFDRDGLRRLAGGEGQRAGPGDVVVVACLGGAIDGAERHRHRLIVGSSELDGKGEQDCLVVLALVIGHVANVDPRLVVENGSDA